MLAKIVGNKEKCVEYWERLLELSPSNQVAYYELQDLYLDTDKYKYYSMRAKYRVIERKTEAAIDDFKKAISNTLDFFVDCGIYNKQEDPRTGYDFDNDGYMDWLFNYT